MKRLALVLLAFVGAVALAPALLLAQNPVPFVNQPLVPSAVAPGGPDFTLTVNGTGFVNGATINWNGSPLATTFVSSSQLTATVPAANIAGSQTASITVTNPQPGGGTSNTVLFQVARKLTSIALSAPVFYSSAPYASSVAVGDFNGDGVTDLAVAGSGSQVAIHLGNGDGTFAPATFYDYPGGANGLAVADFNDDGRLDLAVTTFSNNSPYIFIFLGNGDGSFRLPIGSPTTDELPIVVGDFNGDGKLDIAHADHSTPGVTVLLGNGDGTFKAPITSGSGLLAFELLAGDFNGDGHLDLLSYSAGNCTNCNSSVYVQLGNGDGTFKSPVAYGTVAASNSALAADFNGDGILDLAIGNVATGHFAGSTVSILTGNGSGAFPSQKDYDSGYIPAHLAPGDFNADGILDIATETESDTLSPIPQVAILRGGGGTFSTVKLTLLQARWAGSITAGDFNRDGYLDFAEVGMDDKPYELGIVLQRPNFSISPGVVDFRGQLYGTAKSQYITVTNNTSTPVNITRMTITGANAADFSQTNTCGTSLPQGSCTITVTFTPGDLGPRTASLVITDSGPGGSQTVPLSGTGVNPIVTLSATSLDFGLQPLTVPATKSVTLSVSGDGELSVSSVTASGHFTLAHDCAPTVANGATCTINVTFNPTVGGTATGAITLTDDATNSPQTITLSGTGVAPSVTLSATALDFGSQPMSVTSAAQAVTLTNNGPGPLTFTSVATSGTNAGDFGETNNCVGTIAALAGCSLNVTFSPSAGGARVASLSISDNAAPSPQTVSLTGTGVPPTLTLSPASLSFADQLVGTASQVQTVTVTNTGPGPSLVTDLSASGDFSQTNNCLGTLAASSSCQVNVAFKPTAMGTRTGGIEISDDADGSPQAISLTGNGIAPVVSLAPASLVFGNQGLGTTSAAQTVTLTNTGTASLSVTSVIVNSGFAETNTCGASVAMGASCTISVTFTPATIGTTLGQLTLTDSALDSPQGVPLTGVGVNGAAARLSASNLTFAGQLTRSTSAALTVTLMSSGNALMTISGVSIGGANPGDFGETNTCGTSLDAGADCSISVTFTPSAAGARAATLTIADNAADSPQTVALTGTGQDFVIGPPSGPQTFASVAAGGTANYTLTFTPQGGLAATVTLSCSGTPAKATCTVNPSSLALDGTNPANATVTVTTTAPSAVIALTPTPFSAPPLALWVALFGLAGFVALARLGSGRLRVRGIAARIALLAALAMSASCGGGGSNTVQQPGTPAGNYMLTVTARTTAGTTTVTHTLTLNLHVT
jgi:FG-GAP-like repeat/Abnormal spindle-like microcephaly-assoc'd, ASPM-SPD-2-Hydin/Cep192 domain 4/HYDIN/CFA65/VesB-like, Ig-like domain